MYNNTFQDLKSQSYFDSLNFEQKKHLYQYVNSKPPYDVYQFKEHTYQQSKKDALKGSYGAKGVVFLTTKWEKLRWDFYDKIGIGTNDLIEYDTAVSEFGNRIFKKILFLFLGIIFLFFMFKKAK
jgi:hypothetical protein